MRKLRKTLGNFSQVESPSECYLAPNSMLRPASPWPLLPCLQVNERTRGNPGFCRSHPDPDPQLTCEACPAWRQRPKLPHEESCHGAHSSPEALPLPCLHDGNKCLHTWSHLLWVKLHRHHYCLHLQMQKWTLREVRQLAQGHRAGTQLNTSLPDSRV